MNTFEMIRFAAQYGQEHPEMSGDDLATNAYVAWKRHVEHQTPDEQSIVHAHNDRVWALEQQRAMARLAEIPSGEPDEVIKKLAASEID